MHDAGQPMLATFAGVKKGARYNARRCGLIRVAAVRFKAVALLHDRLPLWSVRPRALVFFTGLPVNNQVSHLVRDGVLQEIVEVFRQQLLVDTQAGCTVAINSGLASTVATQRIVDRGIGELNAVKVAGALLRLADSCFSLVLEVGVGHVS